VGEVTPDFDFKFRGIKATGLGYTVVFVSLSVSVCNACIMAKPYVIRVRRWYRWIKR